MKRLILFLIAITPTYLLVNLYSQGSYLIDIKNNINNIKPISVSDVGKGITYIPLETAKNAIIGEIKKVYINDSYIFVSADSRLLQFDRNGKFIRQIGKNGRGPEEYVFISDFCVDPGDQNIILISSPNRIMLFDKEGVFKNAFNIAFRPARVLPLTGNRLIFYCYNTPGSGFPSWVISDRKGKIVNTYKNSVIRKSKPGFTINLSPFYLSQGVITMMEFGTDTIYQLKNEIKTPYAIFSWGDFKMDVDPVITSSMIKEVQKDPLGRMWVRKIIENKDFLFISYAIGIKDKQINSIFNKNTGAVTFLKDDGFIHGGTLFWPEEITDKNVLVDYIDAYTLLKSAIPSDLRNKLNATSNPVIMLLNPK